MKPEIDSKQGFPHFMLKEIYEQPAVVQSALTSTSRLQLLAYHIAIGRKLEVDRPRNITKSLKDLG